MQRHSLKPDVAEVTLLTISEAARLTRTSRDTIRSAMNLYERSKGLYGLKFVTPLNNRRLIRLSSLRDWLIDLERKSARR